MILNMYSIYDTAAKAYIQPFFMHNDGLAIRAFQDNVNSPDSQINKHPKQFHLYKVGMWDDAEAKIESLEPTCIAYASELLNPSELSELQKETKNLSKLVQMIKSEIDFLNEEE